MQACKLGLVKGFDKDICKLVLGVNVAQVYIILLIVITLEMKVHLYMFGFLVENGILSYTYGTGAVTKQRNSPKL
jgi:hypothetical protein